MIEIYTDGACRGNGKDDAVGGWGFHVIDRNTGETLHEDFGGEVGTTNNRMELQAAIEAVKYAATLPVSDKMRVKIHTDSNYVYKGITTWIHGWIRKDFKDVKNPDQWKELDALNNDLYDWHWIKAHVGLADNEKADLLANKGCDSIKMEEIADEMSVHKELSKKDRFIIALGMIYAVSKPAASDLFDEYAAQTEHNLRSVSNRVYLSIMRDEVLPL